MHFTVLQAVPSASTNIPSRGRGLPNASAPWQIETRISGDMLQLRCRGSHLNHADDAQPADRSRASNHDRGHERRQSRWLPSYIIQLIPTLRHRIPYAVCASRDFFVATTPISLSYHPSICASMRLSSTQVTRGPQAQAFFSRIHVQIAFLIFISHAHIA